MNSNDTFSVFRAFKLLHTRILNELQVEITVLEKKLFELDESDARNGNIERLMTTKHKNEWGTEKLKLMSDLKAKMKEYRKFENTKRLLRETLLMRRQEKFCWNSITSFRSDRHQSVITGPY